MNTIFNHQIETSYPSERARAFVLARDDGQCEACGKAPLSSVLTAPHTLSRTTPDASQMERLMILDGSEASVLTAIERFTTE